MELGSAKGIYAHHAAPDRPRRQTECGLPPMTFRSVAEQGNKMQIGKELQGLSSQAYDAELVPF